MPSFFLSVTRGGRVSGLLAALRVEVVGLWVEAPLSEVIRFRFRSLGGLLGDFGFPGDLKPCLRRGLEFRIWGSDRKGSGSQLKDSRFQDSPRDFDLAVLQHPKP